MCEKCREKAKALAGGPAPEEFVKVATTQLKKWADDTIKAGEGLVGVDPERMKQENAAFKEVNGITLEQAWDVYTRMHEAAAKGEGFTLTPEETRGVGRWITILARSRSDMTYKLEEMAGVIQMAAMLEQLRGESEDAKEKLPMVDLGYGLAGRGGNKTPRDN